MHCIRITRSAIMGMGVTGCVVSRPIYRRHCHARCAVEKSCSEILLRFRFEHQNEALASPSMDLGKSNHQFIDE